MKQQKRTRIDVVFYTPKGSRIQWKTSAPHSHTPQELIEKLRHIADTVEKATAIDNESEVTK
jgi:hypothetical protein